MMKKIILGLFILVNCLFAYEIHTLFNGELSKVLNFTEAGNQTEFFKLPISANITSSSIDITGLYIYATKYIQTLNQSDFSEGTYNKTFYNATNNSVQLNSTYSSGEYISKIFDTFGNSSYQNLSWAEEIGTNGGGGDWWDTSWQYRKNITINNSNNSETLTDYQVPINLTYNNNMQANFSDIRFTYYNSTSKTETEVPYWIETKVNSNWAYVWVKVPEIPANGYATIYIYYGNSNASSASNITSTFIRVLGDGQTLLVSYHFDEESGTIAEDASGNNKNGSLINGGTWVNGKYGNAINLDGVDDYVLSSLNKSDFGSNFTISFWIKPFESPANSIFSIAYEPRANSPWIFLQRYSATTIRWYIDAGYQITQTISDNTYYHLTLTYNGSVWKVYKNGIVDGTYSGPIGGHGGEFTFIGSGYSGYFKGIFDEFLAFNQTLTQEEISDLYNYYGYTTLNLPKKVLIKKYTSHEPTKTINGEETFSTSSNITFQVRTCALSDCSDGTWSINYTNSTYNDISNLPSKRYFQYKAILQAENPQYSPKLYNVSVGYYQNIYPTNVSLNIGNDNDSEWNQTGSLNTTQTISNINTDPPFSNELNNILANNCTCIGCELNETTYTCKAPFVLSSATGGKINISNIDIRYELPCLNLSDPSTYGERIANINGVFYVNDNITLCEDTYSTNQTMFVINSSNIQVNCKGATLTGDGSEGDYGISVPSKNNIIISNCNIRNFYHGFYINGGSNNTLINNSAYNNSYYGFYLSSGFNNTLTNNTAYNNLYQVYITSSSHNFIYNNIFNASTGQQVAYDDSTNFWNISYNCSTPNIIGGSCIGGNWYSDFNGIDNGFGAYPHNVSGDKISDEPEYYSIGTSPSAGACFASRSPVAQGHATEAPASSLRITPVGVGR